MKYAVYATSVIAFMYENEDCEEVIATFNHPSGAREYIEKSKLKRYDKHRMSYYKAKSLLRGYRDAIVGPYVPKHPPHEPQMP